MGTRVKSRYAVKVPDSATPGWVWLPMWPHSQPYLSGQFIFLRISSCEEAPLYPSRTLKRKIQLKRELCGPTSQWKSHFYQLLFKFSYVSFKSLNGYLTGFWWGFNKITQTWPLHTTPSDLLWHELHQISPFLNSPKASRCRVRITLITSAYDFSWPCSCLPFLSPPLILITSSRHLNSGTYTGLLSVLQIQVHSCLLFPLLECSSLRSLHDSLLFIKFFLNAVFSDLTILPSIDPHHHSLFLNEVLFSQKT